MKILHTSDWHIGRTLYGKKRYEEFDAFFHWLADTITKNSIDVLIVAGDVFDTTAPSHRAQSIYYHFLRMVAASPCRHVVIVAGNHDSPSFLNAPKTLLKALDVHVIGQACEVLDDEVLVLRNAEHEAELIVCAVPYLRDRDLRTSEAGESSEDKERKLIAGLRQHYHAVAALAEKKRAEYAASTLPATLPIIATGHLFTAGGVTQEDDGVRDLYVGSLAGISASTFPPVFDYVALGHLHVPQTVNNCEHIRYSGSPLPMGFGEAKQQKSMCLVEWVPKAHLPTANPLTISVLPIPVFQKLERIHGDLATILAKLNELTALKSQAWLEIIYDGAELISDLRERLDQALVGTDMDILRVKNQRVAQRVIANTVSGESLEDLNLEQVFVRCLDAHQVPAAQRETLTDTYREAIRALAEADTLAE